MKFKTRTSNGYSLQWYNKYNNYKNRKKSINRTELTFFWLFFCCEKIGLAHAVAVIVSEPPCDSWSTAWHDLYISRNSFHWQVKEKRERNLFCLLCFTCMCVYVDTSCSLPHTHLLSDICNLLSASCLACARTHSWHPLFSIWLMVMILEQHFRFWSHYFFYMDWCLALSSVCIS